MTYPEAVSFSRAYARVVVRSLYRSRPAASSRTNRDFAVRLAMMSATSAGMMACSS